jgi:hypothetical protein
MSPINEQNEARMCFLLSKEILEWILTLKERMKKRETKPRKRERKP